MSKSGVDVVVPAYNYSAYLERCAQSILDQPGVDVRVLVIDDASTDDTPTVGRRLASQDARVTYRRHAVNHGHIATYNEGLLEWAAAEYVLLISADDLLAPGALQRAVDAMDRNPHATMAHGRQICFESEPPALDESRAAAPGIRVVPGQEFVAAVCSDAQNPVATPTAIVRTRAQHAAGGYDSTLPHTADLEMWLRLATLGDVIHMDACQAYKRQHARNMQLAFLTEPEGDVDERRRAFEIFFARCEPHRIADVNGQRHDVRVALAHELFWRASRLFDLGKPAPSKRLLEAAAAMYPEISATHHWRRMALKRKLGPRMWGFVRKLSHKREQPWA